MTSIDSSRVRIKICGLTTPEQALHAARVGADAIGLVFHPDSPRRVDVAAAREICAALPPFVTTVGLFVDAAADAIERVLAEVPLQMLQFHGNEDETSCRRWGRPYLKAVRMRPDLDVAQAIGGHPTASGILLDSYRPGVPGGTGTRFDWERIPAHRPRPLVLAGGLDAGNVAEAIRRTTPWAVDVSGGVERAPGDKDPDAVAAFVAAVRETDGSPC